MFNAESGFNCCHEETYVIVIDIIGKYPCKVTTILYSIHLKLDASMLRNVPINPNNNIVLVVLIFLNHVLLYYY